ncbi:MAG: hypothetical protein Ct9H300mP11_08970 [Chloroflexota bacterium]|nr:MAG: hypothetical protein Ct9H300mP11_08970 [Chloroflexota bacterium]
MKKVTMSSVPKTKAEMTGGLMTGTQVWRQSILDPNDSNNFNFAIVAFDAGSGTNSTSTPATRSWWSPKDWHCR